MNENTTLTNLLMDFLVYPPKGVVLLSRIQTIKATFIKGTVENNFIKTLSKDYTKDSFVFFIKLTSG